MLQLSRWLLLLALAACTCTTLAVAQSAKRAEAEAELKAVRAEIARIRAQISRDQIERDKLARELQQAETSVAEARKELERLRQERAQHTARRAELDAEKRKRQKELDAERASLAGQLRAAYLIGREEPLKLLLNQKDPARAGRMFAYYSYFGRSRANQIERIETHVREIEALDAELAQQQQRLAELESAQEQEVARLKSARDQRSAVLEQLQAESKKREEALARLQREQSGLEKLLRELRRALQKFPTDSTSAFAKLRGQLAWPVTGKIVARFGESRAGGVKWNGMLLTAERGTPVRAVYHGRVVYADWLPGLGLLTIIDHGEGYLSLYGHNERLFKAVGERVKAGDAIAAVGDSGGRNRPELYFEIRRNGKPVDPRPWFATPKP